MGKLNLTQLRETPRRAVCFQISQAYFCCPSAAPLKLGRWGCPASLPPPARGPRNALAVICRLHRSWEAGTAQMTKTGWKSQQPGSYGGRAGI